MSDGANLFGQPHVLLVVGAMVATALLLTLAVHRSLSAPKKSNSLNEALSFINSSELDIDTDLSSTKKRTTSRIEAWTEYWASAVERTGRIVPERATPGRVAAGLIVAGAFVGATVFPGGLFGLVALPVAAVFAYRAWLGAEANKRTKALERQLPDLLSSLRARLQAGSTVQQALIGVADRLPSPLGDEMRLLKRDLNVNVVLETALQSLSARVPSREMQFLVASVEIAIRSGADLDPQLASIQEIVAQRTRIRQKLATAIAQSKPTTLLAMGAVPLMFAVSMRTEANREYWFSGMGIVFLIAAAGLYAAGVVVIRLMVKNVENS